MASRMDLLTSETESFLYDFLDRLIYASSNSYTENYTYDQLGNITSRNGVAYTYGAKPHAVIQVDSTVYAYDANGNMVTRGDQTLSWDIENRLTTVSQNSIVTGQFIYDGDGKRVKKTENGQRPVSDIEIIAFAKALKVKPSSLLEDSTTS